MHLFLFPLLLSLAAVLFCEPLSCLALTKAEQRKLDSVCHTGMHGLIPGVSQAIKFNGDDIVIACEKEMFEEAMDIPQHRIFHTEHHPFGCFACVANDWLDHYCSLPVPTNRADLNPWRLRTGQPFVVQEEGKTRVGEWRSSNDCNTCDGHGCTMALCGDKWFDRIYHCRK
jgi:hypothetical protein